MGYSPITVCRLVCAGRFQRLSVPVRAPCRHGRKRTVFGEAYDDRYALLFAVRVTADSLNIRSGPGTSYPVSGSVKKDDAYTVTETRDDFGKLKSGAGWISLKYTERA